MNNDEISSMIEMAMRSAYYGTKLSRVRDDMDWSSVAAGIGSTLDAMSYFNMDVQSLYANSLSRMMLAGIE